MQIVDIDINYKAEEESVIALGNFDGIHLAHRQLINKLVAEAKENSIKSSILIFESHTKNTIESKKQSILTSNSQRFKILEELGLDIVYKIKFDDNIMKIEANEFVEKFLCQNLKARGIVVGYNYRFGYKALGTTKLLKSLACKNNFKLSVIEEVTMEGETVSSTSIRNLISSGKIKLANTLLGREYNMQGKVVHGKFLGTKMGFPTANLELKENYIIPKLGVYDSDIIIDNKKYKAATNIGKNPSVENSGIRIEAHIINFSKSIYGEEVEIILHSYIRPEIKFDNIKDLFRQIEDDVNFIKSRN